MSYNIVAKKELEYDTVVIGGGVAGCAAAAASARGGARTLLVEEFGVLGGQAVVGLVTPLDARFSRSGESFGGLLEEIADRVTELSKEYCSRGETGNLWDIASPHILKYVLLELCDGAGADIMLHTTLIACNTENGRIKSVLLSTESGFVSVEAKTFIDASGDADLAALCGAELVKGSEPGCFEALTESGLDHSHFSSGSYGAYERDGLMQPTSIFILMGGVNYEEYRKHKLNNRELHFGDLGITEERFRSWKFCGSPGFEINGDRIPTPQGRVLISPSNRPDTAVINMSRITGIDGSDAESLNRGEIAAQKQIIAIADFLINFIPGFENAYYSQSGFTLGVRETRRIRGRYVLTGLDAINCRKFENSIARGSYMIDIHDPNGKARAIGGDIKGDSYDIPYGCIVSKNTENLLACGRCISADHIAHSSTRIQGTCILTGQAAGSAAALAAAEGISVSQIEPAVLHGKLVSEGVRL